MVGTTQRKISHGIRNWFLDFVAWRSLLMVAGAILWSSSTWGLSKYVEERVGREEEDTVRVLTFVKNVSRSGEKELWDYRCKSGVKESFIFMFLYCFVFKMKRILWMLMERIHLRKKEADSREEQWDHRQCMRPRKVRGDESRALVERMTLHRVSGNASS